MFRAFLPEHEATLPGYHDLLSPEERLRADRLRHPGAHVAFVVGRGLLRELLGRVCGRSPKDILLQRTPQGRPFLAPGQGDWVFNLSHSGDWVLLGLCRNRDLGLDVEAVSPRMRVLELARRFFAKAETAALEQAPPADQRRLFFEIWVRKEAYVKALGVGLSLPLPAFSVLEDPGGTPGERPVSSPSGARGWLFGGLSVAPGYAAALATRPPWPVLSLFEAFGGSSTRGAQTLWASPPGP